VTVLITFAVPGVPGGSIIAMVPVLAVASVPPEGLGILLGVDAIPDMFRTAANAIGGSPRRSHEDHQPSAFS
jgi:Na+/H+-dicarboxylate symporter